MSEVARESGDQEDSGLPLGKVRLLNLDLSICVMTSSCRLIKYSENPESGGIPSEIKLFDIFSTEVSEIIQNHKNVATVDGLAMLSSVLNLALTVYPAEISYVDQLLAFCLKCIQSVPEADVNTLTLKVFIATQ